MISRAVFNLLRRPIGQLSIRSVSTRHDENGIRTITLSNPKKRNALSLEMLESIKDNITYKLENDSLRVIVLAAQGPVFSAGHDLKELRDNSTSYQAKVFDTCSEVMKLVQDIPIPVIAKVQGLATAAGCQLVASCDLAIAADSAKFATPGVSVGLFCSTPGIAVARSVPKKIALKMLFTGEPITASEALNHGLISCVVPEKDLDSETERLANKICETSKPVISLGKKFFYRQISLTRDSAYQEGGVTMVDNLDFADAKEGLDAFINKRKPLWKHL